MYAVDPSYMCIQVYIIEHVYFTKRKSWVYIPVQHVEFRWCQSGKRGYIKKWTTFVNLYLSKSRLGACSKDCVYVDARLASVKEKLLTWNFSQWFNNSDHNYFYPLPFTILKIPPLVRKASSELLGKTLEKFMPANQIVR